MSEQLSPGVQPGSLPTGGGQSPPENTFRSKEIGTALVFIQGLLVVMALILLVVAVGVRDENPSQTPFALMFSGVVFILAGSLTFLSGWYSKREQKRLAKSLNDIRNNPHRSEWNDRRKMFGGLAVSLYALFTGGAFLINMNVGLVFTGMVILIFFLVWIMEGGLPQRISLKAEGIEIRNKRGKKRLIPRESLAQVFVAIVVVEAHSNGVTANSRREECRVEDGAGQLLLRFQDHFEWPLVNMGQQIGAFYRIPFEDRRIM